MRYLNFILIPHQTKGSIAFQLQSVSCTLVANTQLGGFFSRMPTMATVARSNLIFNPTFLIR